MRAVRDELRGRLRVVLASRMALMDAEQARLEQEIAAFAEKITSGAAEIGTMEATQHSLTERGYELDRDGQDAQNRANGAAVELERAAARERGNAERVTDLEARLAAAAGELEQTQTQLGSDRRRAPAAEGVSGDGGRRGSCVSRKGGGAAARGARGCG